VRRQVTPVGVITAKGAHRPRAVSGGDSPSRPPGTISVRSDLSIYQVPFPSGRSARLGAAPSVTTSRSFPGDGCRRSPASQETDGSHRITRSHAHSRASRDYNAIDVSAETVHAGASPATAQFQADVREMRLPGNASLCPGSLIPAVGRGPIFVSVSAQGGDSPPMSQPASRLGGCTGTQVALHSSQGPRAPRCSGGHRRICDSETRLTVLAGVSPVTSKSSGIHAHRPGRKPTRSWPGIPFFVNATGSLGLCEMYSIPWRSAMTCETACHQVEHCRLPPTIHRHEEHLDLPFHRSRSVYTTGHRRRIACNERYGMHSGQSPQITSMSSPRSHLGRAESERSDSYTIGITRRHAGVAYGDMHSSRSILMAKTEV